MKRRTSSSGSEGRRGSQDVTHNIQTKPPRIYDNLTRRLLQFGITLAITTFIGLIVRYVVQEFDPSVSTITVTTSRVDNKDIASLSVSKNFLERILEFIEESIAIVATIIPIGFPICTIFNRYFAKSRAGTDKIEINNNRVLSMIPKYVIIGDAQACQMPNSVRLRPLVRDTFYQLIKSRLKPKLIVEDSYEEARKLGIRIGLIRREHHKLAVIKSMDLLRNITDSRGDIKQDKVRYLLSRMKIMSQATPADKSLLIYLMKHCETQPNENLAYLGYSFTDPEAMRLADCAITFQDCDDDDVKKESQVILKSESTNFTDLYLFMIVCLLSSNITQSYALYQISASVSCCIYRFLSITVFQEQLISRSQFNLIVLIQQVFAIIALMTKWLSSLPQAPLHHSSAAEMSHAATEDSLAASGGGGGGGGETSGKQHYHHRAPKYHHRSSGSIPANGGYEQTSSSSRGPKQATSMIQMHKIQGSSTTEEGDNDTAQGDNHRASSFNGSSSSLDDAEEEVDGMAMHHHGRQSSGGSGGGDESRRPSSGHSGARKPGRRRFDLAHKASEASHHIHLSGVDLDLAVINSKLVTTYKQTFHNSSLIDDVTYRLAKLHIAYQVLVMIIIMIFGNAMFQLNMNNNRQHQTLAFNSLIMNNIFNLANCFNQFGEFNLRSGFRHHPFFVCVLLLAVFLQVSLTELNAFGLENLNPIQWFVCFVFALLSALIAPLTGQQHRQRGQQQQKQQQHQSASDESDGHPHSNYNYNYKNHHDYQQQQVNRQQRKNFRPSMPGGAAAAAAAGAAGTGAISPSTPRPGQRASNKYQQQQQQQPPSSSQRKSTSQISRRDS